ncbi:extracellular solute-binding protein [Niameybacter massiliensis]|uniref:Extracellular solute-binding protein n=1 Tax=Holtiella tumoricola TaxID=3018743 RepID=A0AA42DMT9_9FIRM|nr:extracellular solute-binding protein [Holtiella tumoricola]MDA3731820.1 extracellular solute-binding protein [Holtiella tumoricola]
MKKMVSLMLSGVMLASSLVGCASGEKVPTPSTDVTSKTNESTDTPDTNANETTEKAEITIWRTSQQNEVYRDLDKLFMEENPDVNVKVVIKEGDPQHEFMQSVAMGNAPDLVQAEFMNLMKFAANGILEPLNPMLESWGEWPQFNQSYVDILTRDGNTYGVPYLVIPMLFAYNKAIFEENGITELPKDWDQALDIAKKVNDPSKQIIGYSTLTAEWTEWFFQYYVWQAGGDLTKENSDGTIELTFTDPAAIEAAKYYQKLKAEGVLQSDLTLKFNDLIDQFAQGRIAMMPCGGDWISRFVNAGMDPDDIGIMVSPAGPGGKQDSAIGGSSFGIRAGLTDNVKNAAFKYITFITGQEAIEFYFDEMASKGATDLLIIARDDMNVGQFYDLPEEYIAILEEAKAKGRLEFYGKPEFGGYVDRVVQKLFIDPNMDIEAEFKAAQDLATKEKLDEFNKLNKVSE